MGLSILMVTSFSQGTGVIFDLGLLTFQGMPHNGLVFIYSDFLMVDSSCQFDTKAPASLYVVSTPIGNLGDLSARARQVLELVDRVAAEDTRNTARLLDMLGIKKPLLAHHAHNESQSAQGLLNLLRSGESIALVSDAGTPAVSDPGAELVDLVARAGIPVVPVPGASSVLAVVAASGLVQGPFTFRGFLPTKSTARRELLSLWLQLPEPQVLFEAPHRIEHLAEELFDLCNPERQICAGREITKQHETFYRGNAEFFRQAIRDDVYATKGEWALVIQGYESELVKQADSIELKLQITELAKVLLKFASTKTVVQELMQISGLPKNKIYPLVLSLKDE